MKKRTIIILVIVLIVAAAGFVVYRKVQETEPDIVNKKPHLSTDVSSLLAAFNKDSASASKMYIDKIVEVKGLVKRIDTSGAVILGEEGNPSEVVMGFDRRHMKDFEKIKEGSVAVFQGWCSGYSNSGNNDPDDLFAMLGTTIQFRSSGVKDKQ